MQYLVTGGRGFIGSHFVEHLLAEGHDVIDVDKMTYAAHLHLPWDNHPNYKLIPGDIAKIDHLPLCDVIVNFAAESHVDNSLVSPMKFFDSNIGGVFNLLSLLRGKVYERPLFVHISTDEVYGDIIEGTVDEHSALNPGNPYAGTKAAADMLVLSYGDTFKLDYQIVRSTNNYGPRQYPEKLIPRIIHCLETEKKIPLHGDGSYVRDWLYVKDNVRAIYEVCQAKKKNQIWNVCSYNYLTNNQVVAQVCGWFGKDPGHYIKYVENRMGQDYRYSISSEKIRKELGWSTSDQDNVLKNFVGVQP